MICTQHYSQDMTANLKKTSRTKLSIIRGSSVGFAQRHETSDCRSRQCLEPCIDPAAGGRLRRRKPLHPLPRAAMHSSCFKLCTNNKCRYTRMQLRLQIYAYNSKHLKWLICLTARIAPGHTSGAAFRLFITCNSFMAQP